MNEEKIYFEKYKKKVDDHIDQYLREWSSSGLDLGYSSHIEMDKVLERFQYNAQGGKRIRAILIIFSYEIFAHDHKISDEMLEVLLNISIGIELFQTGILAQDDIIDKSSVRRNKNSLPKDLSYDMSANPFDDKGMSLSICLGDIFAVEMIDLINQTSLPDSLKLKVIKIASHMMKTTVLGQMIDINFSYYNSIPPKEDIIKMYEMKTSYYTIGSPLVIGATVAMTSDKNIPLIRKLGSILGIIFQVRDDLKDFNWHVSQNDGKPPSDITEGKSTLIISYFYELADEKSKKEFSRYYGKKTDNEQLYLNIQKLKILLTQTKTLDKVNNFILSQINECFDIVKEIDIDEQGKSNLNRLISYIAKD